MNDVESLRHMRWECKCHIVFIPKRRKKLIYVQLRKELGAIFKELVQHREGKVEEGHLMGDHVHMLVSIPPKYSVSQVVGYIKGKSVIHIARRYMGKRQDFFGQHFWARGYYVSTVGRDETTIREYIRKQEEADERANQLEMFD